MTGPGRIGGMGGEQEGRCQPRPHAASTHAVMDAEVGVLDRIHTHKLRNTVRTCRDGTQTHAHMHTHCNAHAHTGAHKHAIHAYTRWWTGVDAHTHACTHACTHTAQTHTPHADAPQSATMTSAPPAARHCRRRWPRGAWTSRCCCWLVLIISYYLGIGVLHLSSYQSRCSCWCAGRGWGRGDGGWGVGGRRLAGWEGRRGPTDGAEQCGSTGAHGCYDATVFYCTRVALRKCARTARRQRQAWVTPFSHPAPALVGQLTPGQPPRPPRT